MKRFFLTAFLTSTFALATSAWATMPILKSGKKTDNFQLEASLRSSLDLDRRPDLSPSPRVGELTLLNSPASRKGPIPTPKVVAKIDISEQRMQVFVDGEQRYIWKVSTGRRGYYTPRGTYSPYRMHKMWRSRKYNNAPMPYAVFFHKGWAVHGTNAIRRLGRPASHGCVRLHPKNAKAFYHLIKKAGGMKQAKVVIQN